MMDTLRLTILAIALVQKTEQVMVAVAESEAHGLAPEDAHHFAMKVI